MDNSLSYSLEFHAGSRTLFIDLSNEVGVVIPVDKINELQDLDSDTIATQIELGLGGDTIEISEKDIHIFIPGLLSYLLGIDSGYDYTP